MVIEVDGLTRSFGATAALAGVSFGVGQGEIVGLLGPNGAGKTTTVRVLATLLRPDGGSARVGGVSVTDDPRRVRQLIGLAGQAAAVDELLSGRENIELIAGLYGIPTRERQARAGEVLERFDLVGVADRRAGTYSGGMRRRLDLAATLAGRPSVMLLDEPTAGLDPRSRLELWSLVDAVAADGTTVLLTSQYLEEVERLATRIVLLDRGVVVADGTPDALKRAVGADVLEAHVFDGAAVDVAGALLADLGDRVSLDHHQHRVIVSTRQGTPALIAAARRLDDADIRLADLALHRPSLDEVFLALTGDARTAELDLPAAPALSASPVSTVSHRRHGLADLRLVTTRYLRRFVRMPQVVFLGTVQPIVFVIMLNAVFGGLVADVHGGSYVQYLVPGVLVMTVLLGGGVTASGLSEDVRDGMVDRFRSLPMSRAAVLLGRTLTDVVRYALAIALLVAVGALMGFRLHGGLQSAIGAFALILLFAFAISWLFCVLGLAVKESQAATLVSLLVALPLVYLSGVWIPVESMSARLQVFARNQPVNVLVEAVRALFAGEPAGPRVGHVIAWSAVLLAMTVPLAVRQYRGDGGR